MMSDSVLLISAAAGALQCRQMLEDTLNIHAVVAENRRAAIAALRRAEYVVVVMDDGLALGDPAGAEVLWKQSGLAIPLQINFGISGCDRVVREIRSAIARREHEQMLSMRAAASVVESELNSVVTGLMLQAELALAEKSLTPPVAARLKIIADLTNSLKDRLRNPTILPRAAGPVQHPMSTTTVQ